MVTPIYTATCKSATCLRNSLHMVSLSWSQALAWRMRQQLLDPVGTESVAGVVRRLGAIPAQLDAAAELAVRARRERSRSGEVARALAEGRIIKTFAFRGATHLMTPRGRWRVPCLAGRQSDVGAPQLAEATTAWRRPTGHSFGRLSERRLPTGR